jgi:DNA mismatch repair ATPase MutS
VSTFLEEMLETSAVLQHATAASLVVIDELGRGTSTHDGAAIAHAVVHQLASRVRCRTLFATHHHRLVCDFASASIQLMHMVRACRVGGLR